MPQELIYTSAPRGIFPGKTGFCTVQITEGMPRPVIELLETFSNVYRPMNSPLWPPGEPVSISFIRARTAGQQLRILSRNASAPSDHTGRSNNLAHHLVFDAGELTRIDNPASLAASRGLFVTQWDGRVQTIPARTLPTIDGPSGSAPHWQQLTGDSGWASVVTDAWISDNGPLYLIYEPGIALLPLLAEAIAQLPQSRRADATFTTYHTGLPTGIGCIVRCVPTGSEHEGVARKSRHLVLKELAHQRPPRGDRPAKAARNDSVLQASQFDDDDTTVTYGLAPPAAVAIEAPPPNPAGPPRMRRSRRDDERESSASSRPIGLIAALVASIMLNLGISGLYLSKEFPIADAQQAQKIAERERDDAVNAKNNAEGERNAAVEKKLKAERDLRAAIDAKEKAEKTSTEALEAKENAEKSRNDAVIAKWQAEMERENAVTPKQQAEEKTKKMDGGGAKKNEPVPPQGLATVTFFVGIINANYEEAQLTKIKDEKASAIKFPVTYNKEIIADDPNLKNAAKIAKDKKYHTVHSLPINLHKEKDNQWYLEVELKVRYDVDTKNKEVTAKSIADAVEEAKKIIESTDDEYRLLEMKDKLKQGPNLFIFK